MTKRIRIPLVLVLCLVLCLFVSPAAFAREAEGTTAAPADTAAAADPTDHIVSVTFECDNPDVLNAFSVYDSAGRPYAPVTDAESGEPVFGRYALAPGEYRYAFDGAGRYEDLEADFTVRKSDAQFFYLDLTPIFNEMSLSFTYINPLYADVVSEADIPEVPVDAGERLAELKELASALDSPSGLMSARFLWDSGIIYTDTASAASDLRTQIKAHEDLATIRIKLDGELTFEQINSLCQNIYAAAIAHTGVSTEGDYLRYEFGGYNAHASSIQYDTKTSCTLCEIDYALLYYTSVEQEEELTPVVNSLLAELALDGKSDYEKILTIFQYLNSNVEYGGSDRVQYTAYGALVNKLAVCQGYSTAFYRLCLESGVDARIITSKDMKHAWNIARFGGQYYEMDCTWGSKSLRYFLRGSDYWLSNHTLGSISSLGDEFSKSAFSARYKLPVYDFADVQALVKYLNPSLEGRIAGFEDYIANVARALGSSALGLDEIQVRFITSKLSGSTDDAVSYTLYPVIRSYSQNSLKYQHTVTNSELISGPAFSLRVQVPDAWAGKAARYTLSSSGYEDVSEVCEVTQSSTSGNYTILMSNITHFGTVTIERMRSVTFHAENGTDAETVYVMPGEFAAKPADPTREGFTFLGWYAPEAAEPFDFDKTPITEDITLTAHWEALTYELRYDPNGGESAPEAQRKTHGVDLPLSTAVPVRADSSGSYTVTLNANGGDVSVDTLNAERTTSYVFASWNTAADGTGTSYVPGASYKANEAAVLYAQWIGSSMTSAVTLPLPQREGFTFLGWNTDRGAGGGVVGPYIPSKDETLYAIWDKYTVSFSTDGGSAVPVQTVPCGSTAARPVSPVKAGFCFSGWYTDSSFAEVFDFDSTPITSDTVIYARWLVPDLVLPAALTTIEEEAFAGGAFRFVLLPDQTEEIGSRAFADCPDLAFIYIPESVYSIASDAFGDTAQLTVFGKAGGSAERYADAHGYGFVAVS